MLPNGLHSAIAAWIDAKRAYPGFLSVPSDPLPVTPTHLEPIVTGAETSGELAMAAEFALLTNFIPRKGHPSQPFGPSPALWLVHRETLASMQFAAQSLTPAETREVERAREVLYTSDEHGRTTPSEQFLTYQEMRAVVEQLEEERQSPEAIRAAYADWLVLGHKTEVEAALGVLDRSARRSSRTDAGRERRDLEDEVLLRAAETAFAPTYFAPLSATQEVTWSQVRVPYAELRAAVRGDVDATAHAFLKSTAEGYCEFGYAVLEVVRHWFSPRLYFADDWRLPGGQVVSMGTGTEGCIPAYPQSVYLARVLALSTPLGPGGPGGSGTSGTGPLTGVLTSAPLVVNPLGGVRPRPILAAAAVGVTRAGVAGAAGSAAKSSPTLRALVNLSAPIAVGGVSHRVLGRPVSARVLPERADWTARLDRLRLSLQLRRGAGAPRGREEPAPSTPAPATASPALVVGFGCALLPLAPNPNESYEW